MTSNQCFDLESDGTSLSTSTSPSQISLSTLDDGVSSSYDPTCNSLTGSKANLLSKEKSKKLDSLWFGSVACCLLICISLATCVAVLFHRVETLEIGLRKERRLRELDDGKLCLLCEEIRLGPFKEDNPLWIKLDITTKNGQKLCCSKSANHNAMILKLFWERRQLLQNATDALRREECQGKCSSGTNNRPPGGVSAHLLAGIQSEKDNKGRKSQPIRNWNRNDAVSHLIGLSLHNDRIRINTSGLYFIYSQVTNNVFYNGNRDTRMARVLFHYVYRYNVIYPNGGEQLLMKTSTTECWDERMLFGDYPSYTGSAIYLHSGDEVYVKVSNITLLSRDPKAVYFGLVKLS